VNAPFHQSQLAPAENKFHKGNGKDKKHYWLTPVDLYARLHAEFGFTFDPCPYPLPDGFDGLTCEWGAVNYANPPFGSILKFKTAHNCKHEIDPEKPRSRTCIHCGEAGKKLGPTAWMRKAILEWQKGKTVVLVYPVDKWVLLMVKTIFGEAVDIRNLGDVKWVATEDSSAGKGTGRHIACFILRATSHSSQHQPPQGE
jgi:hypothetical protein